MRVLLLLAALLLPGGCTDNSAPSPASGYVQCENPRPEVCPQHYAPVCGSRDTGIRCVTTPCDSSEWRRYSNACMACADADVYGFTEGDCDTAQLPPGR